MPDKSLEAAKKMVEDECDFYRDKYDRNSLYVEFKKANDTVCCTEIDDPDFKSFLRMRFAELHPTMRPPDTTAIIRWVRDQNSYYGELPSVEVYRRVAGSLSTKVEYALYDDEQNIVQISATGWNFTSEPENLFLTSSRAVAQVTPARSSSNLLELLRPFINMSEDFFKLFVILLVHAFCGGHHHFLAVLEALAGSGKTFLTRLYCELVDPTAVEGRGFPNSIRELHILLASSYLVCFDNLRSLSKEQSDALCMAITGGYAEYRKLYSDNETIRMRLHNTILMNGLDVIPEQPDLATRCLLFKMRDLSQGKTESEEELWEEFQRVKPEILGLIFETISKAMKLYSKNRNIKKPRLADAFIDMVYIAEALGIDEAEFQRIYKVSESALQKRRANTPIIEAVREFMDSYNKRKYMDNATNAYNAIRTNYSGDKSLLPKRPADFSKRLENEAAALKAAGFRILVDDTGEKGSTITIIRKKE